MGRVPERRHARLRRSCRRLAAVNRSVESTPSKLPSSSAHGGLAVHGLPVSKARFESVPEGRRVHGGFQNAPDAQVSDTAPSELYGVLFTL
jgi:hypothetical protein